MPAGLGTGHFFLVRPRRSIDELVRQINQGLMKHFSPPVIRQLQTDYLATAYYC